MTTEMKTEIDIELARERLDKVLEAMHSAPTIIVGLQTETIARVAETETVHNVLVHAGLCTKADLLNQIAANIEDRVKEMVSEGILDEEALSFQTTDDDELGEV